MRGPPADLMLPILLFVLALLAEPPHMDEKRDEDAVDGEEEDRSSPMLELVFTRPMGILFVFVWLINDAGAAGEEADRNEPVWFAARMCFQLIRPPSTSEQDVSG